MMNKVSPLRLADLDERAQQAVRELQDTIIAHYPTTAFSLQRSPDDPDSIHLLAVVDIDDPDEVGDLVVDRVVAFQVEESIPLHVIPLRTPERVWDTMAAPAGVQRGGRVARLWGESV